MGLILSAFLIFVCVGGKILAQDIWRQPNVFEHISQEQGLSFNTVTSFAQDKQGFLWIGTFNGLNRYDGMAFKIFNQKKIDSLTTQQRNIRLLYADKEGDIWIVSFDNTIERLNPRAETFSPVELPRITSKNRDYVHCIAEDAAGTLWISTVRGLFFFDRLRQKIRPYDLPGANVLLSIPLGGIIETASNEAGQAERELWIRKQGGLLKLSPTTRKVEYVNIIDSLRDKLFAYCNPVKDSSGFLWFCDTAGLYCFHPRTRQICVHIPQQEYIAQSVFKNPPKNYFTLRTGCCAPDGTLWFGSNGGIVIVRYQGSPEAYTLRLLQSNDANPFSLSGDAVRTIFADKSGVVWVGGEPFGINKYTAYKQKFALYRHLPFDTNSLGNNYVRGVCLSRSGVLWVATHFGGISRYEPQRGIWTRFRDDIGKSIPKHLRLPINEIWAIFEDNEGTVWAGTRGKGLLKFDKTIGGFQVSTLIPQDIYVQVITEDRRGNLLIGTRGGTPNAGMFVIPPQRNSKYVEFISTQVSDMNGDIIAIHEDSFGKIWAGGIKDLMRIDIKTKKIENLTAKLLREAHLYPTNVGSVVSALMEDHEGNIWISSKGGGLIRYNYRKDTFETINEQKGLPSNSVYAALEDNIGNFWISSDAGLTLWKRRENTFRTFTTEDGLQGQEFNRLSYFKSADGTMLFGGTNGLNVVQPDHIQFNPFVPPVALTALKIFAREVSIDSIITRVHGQETITLAYNQNFISFAFAALDFHVPNNNQYVYRLEGVDKEWIYNGTKREATYTNLNPGEYVFRVRAANNDGVWNNEGLTVNVAILPPWWQTWWFRIVLILSGLGVMLLVIRNYRSRIQRLQQHRQELLLHIEERQRAEIEMQRSEEKFRALFETSTLGMVLWQQDGVILEMNAAFTRLLGYEREQGIALNFWQILGETHSSAITYSLKQRRAFGPIEQSLSQANDEKIAVVMYGIAIGNYNEHQGFERVWSVVEDITERKRATDALLRYQLNPHFMFNVLNSVNALMVENQRNAKRMIIQFSSLLRHTLVASTRQTAPLGDEIDAVEHYLAIEKIRFEERLEAVVHADRTTLGLNVPVFLVQPLVENAIKYGMQEAQTTLRITVSSRIEEEQLCIEVANTGKWLESGDANTVHGKISNTSTNAALTKKRSTGIGLTNLRKRLEQYYPQSHSMTISEEQGMVWVRITIALKELSQTKELSRK